jgi:hypothetical protein
MEPLVPENIFAFTVPSGAFPEYLSVNDRNGKVEVTVRGPSKHLGEWIECGNCAAISITYEQAAALAEALVKHAHGPI